MSPPEAGTDFPLPLDRRGELKGMLDAGEREWSRTVLDLAGQLLRADDEIRALHQRLHEATADFAECGPEPAAVEPGWVELDAEPADPRLVIEQVIVLDPDQAGAVAAALVRAIGAGR